MRRWVKLHCRRRVILSRGFCVLVAMIYQSAYSDINAAPIVIGEKCWLATDVSPA